MDKNSWKSRMPSDCTQFMIFVARGNAFIYAVLRDDAGDAIVTHETLGHLLHRVSVESILGRVPNAFAMSQADKINAVAAAVKRSGLTESTPVAVYPLGKRLWPICQRNNDFLNFCEQVDIALGPR